MHQPAAVPQTLRRLSTGMLALAATLMALAIAPAASSAAPCTPPVVNAVACENTQQGVPPSEWQALGDESIQGFATSMSVNKGDTISFKIKSVTSNFRIDILRLGYYGGDGARMMQANLAPTGPSSQPPCQTFSSSGLIDCGNWSVTRSWTVPTTAVSGVYIAHLVRNDTGGDSQIIFVVRDDADAADMVVQTSDTTWQAYNDYGGNSLYRCAVDCPPGEPAGYKAAYKVSYNRPLQTEGPSALFTGAEYPMIRFLEANGYDATYVSGVDVHRRPNVLLNRKLFISSGHDEYWSATQRTAMENARAAGVNLAFFTGNEGFWKTRWEPSAAGATTADRTLVSYKDTHFTERQDPVEWTGTWRDPRFTTASENVAPENALTGQSFVVNSGTSRITVPYAFRQLRMWRNTAVTSLAPNTSLALAPDTLGYEWDEDPDNGFRPAGSFRLSSTTVNNVEVFTDYGSNTKFGGTATHNLTMYRAPSGARVFGAGTVQWAFGLDDWNPGGNQPDRNMQQATVNLFADMGSQPATRLSGLVAATASTDTTKPTAMLTSPPATAADGNRITLSGTASDAGGVVAGVEVSTDDGATWHLATGTTSWSYSWVVHGAPTATIKVRATDDSGNTQTPGASSQVTVTCPCSLWGTGVTPDTPDAGDTSPVEVGVKFKTDVFGTVSGVRFYKSAANTGVHTGSLWTEDGQRLAQATFSNESATGWQTVTFAEPVAVQPNTTYVASYFAPNGHYAATSEYFYRSPSPGPNGGAIADSPPLRAVRNAGTTVNGLYGYGSSGGFPTASYKASNYWVDVMFAPTPAPGQVTGVTASEGGQSSANVSWNAPTTGGAPTSYKVTPYVGATAQTPKVVSATSTSTTVTGLTTGTTYRFTVQATNPNGDGPASALSNAVTPSAPVVPAAPTGVKAQPGTASARVSWTPSAADGDSPITGQTVTPYVDGTAQTPVQVSASATIATVSGLVNGTSYTFKVSATNAVGSSPQSAASNTVTPQTTIFDFTTPVGSTYVDHTPVELGVKFTADFSGSITGVRFYKAPENVGTHVGSLWNSAGQRIGQATFTNETASGWQAVVFPQPIQVTAGTTYVASYFSPEGAYTATTFGLASSVDGGPVQTVANSTSSNGVYAYGAASNFPTGSYDAANYWVDVMYALPVPGQPTDISAAASGATSATVTWTAPSSGGPVSSYRITPYVGSTAEPAKAKTVTAPSTSGTVTGLTSGTTYTFRVEAINANGAGQPSLASNAVTPAAAVAPAAPTNVRATPATASARVTWDASAIDGDSPITGQTVTPYVGSTAQTPVQVGPSATSTTVSDLTNGTSYTFKVTATNAVGTSPPSAASNAAIPQATILDFATPAVADSGDTSAVALGVKFRSSFPGSVTGIRFYKGPGNAGTHIGTLWNASGGKITEATFANETSSGWQTVLFASPVTITADTTYVASYFAPNGHYSVTGGGFSSAVANGPLTALADGTSANGVYAYGASNSFPQGSFGAGNYFVDVLFAPASAPGTPTGVTATAGPSSATVSWTAPSSGGPVTSYTITPYIGSTAQTPKTITGSPPATNTTVSGLTPGQAYTFTVKAANLSGSGPASGPSAPVTPTGASAPGAPTGVTAQADAQAAIVRWTAPSNDGGSPITGYTITPSVGGNPQTPVQTGASATDLRVTGLTAGTAYTFTVKAVNGAGSSAASSATSAVTPGLSLFSGSTPATIDSGDPGAVNLGVKFRSDVAGTVTGLRFYKASGNAGPHVGTLYDAAGATVRQSTFGNETASGWQAVTFATPVAVTADTTYVASYHAPNGHYSVTTSAFNAGPFDNAPLHALANSESRNGVYVYGGSPAFPTNDWNSANYWVDVLFVPAST
jgi:hypothetical protein